MGIKLKLQILNMWLYKYMSETCTQNSTKKLQKP